MSVEIVDQVELGRLRRRARWWPAGWGFSLVMLMFTLYFASLVRAERETLADVARLQNEQAMLNTSFEAAWHQLQVTSQATIDFGQSMKGLVEARIPPNPQAGRR